MEIRMFDILQVDFGETIGSEQGGVRPAVVVQNNKGNKYSPTVLVIPITSKIRKLYLPTHYLVHKTDNNGLDRDSMLVGEQLKAIDRTRIKYKRGSFNTDQERKATLNALYANTTGEKGAFSND